MPLLQSEYKPGIIYHRHISTIYMGRIRRAPLPSYNRQRISYAGDDFLDLDWIQSGSSRLVIISHGLEGSSQSHAVRTLACFFEELNFDILALNFRGCSGEPNRQLPSYNSGSSEQLSSVIENVLKEHAYQEIFLIGISVGGNITLKYLGESGSRIDSRIRCAATISVPCDLAGSARELAKPENSIYMRDFLKSLRAKLISKQHLMPEKLDLRSLAAIRTFEEFDDLYTAPIHGFRSASEYYKKSSSLYYIDSIRIPTLLLSARDDPFLSNECFPGKIASESRYFYLEASSKGGHVAFPGCKSRYWLGKRISHFFASQP